MEIKTNVRTEQMNDKPSLSEINQGLHCQLR